MLAETVSGVDAPLAFAEPIAVEPRRELIIARLVEEAAERTETMIALDERRKRLAARQLQARGRRARRSGLARTWFGSPEHRRLMCCDRGAARAL